MEKVSLGKAIIQGKCPRCRKGNIFPTSIMDYRKLSVVNQNCPVCGTTLNPEPDFYYGAMYISYAFSVALMVNVVIIINFLFDDPNVWYYVGAVFAVNVLLVPLMLRYSKVLYLYGIGRLNYNPEWDKRKNIEN